MRSNYLEFLNFKIGTVYKHRKKILILYLELKSLLLKEQLSRWTKKEQSDAWCQRLAIWICHYLILWLTVMLRVRIKMLTVYSFPF